MRHGFLRIVLALLGTAAIARADGARPLTVEQARARAQSAPTVSEERSTVAVQGVDGIRGLRAQFVVAAPPDVVLRTLWDVEKFPEMFPDIEEMHVRARAETQIDVEFFVDAVVKKARYTLRRDLDRDARTIRWREVGEGDVRTIRGAWIVSETEDANHALITYDSFVDVGVFVPTALVRDLALEKVAELAGRVRSACRRALDDAARAAPRVDVPTTIAPGP